jgi:hypothetical protein
MNIKTLPQQKGVLKARIHKKVGPPLISDFKFEKHTESHIQP